MLAKAIFFSSCATIFAGTTYVVGIAMAPPPTYKVTNEQRINKFDEIANVYESKTKKQEFYLGIGRWRRRVLKEAHGRVLEVGAGTGSNLELYPADKCDEVIFCDRSPHMLEQAAQKIKARLGYTPFRYPDFASALPAPPSQSVGEVAPASSTQPRAGGRGDEPVPHPRGANDAPSCTLHPGLQPIGENLVMPPEGVLRIAARSKEVLAKQLKRLQYLEANPTEHLPASRASQDDLYALACYPSERLPFPNNSFDTVVDMFGLCSFDDPIKALLEMSRVCKPDGKILLLEHGKGSWEKLNGYLDKWAPRHASMWGCWWNRDIRRYIRLSGAHLLEREEKHFGTSQYMVLKPFKSMAELRAEQK